MPRSSVVRLRTLSPGQAKRLEGLRTVARLLDSAFVVPGTSYRIGLDPILGLIPGIGDIVSPLFTIGLLWQAHDLGVPRIVQLRMLFNVAIDALVGVIPFAGDLFDFVWKSNDKNLALLELHALAHHRASAADWIFVLLIVLLVLVVAIAPFLLAGYLIGKIF